MSFIVPFLAEEFASSQVIGDSDALNDDYLKWIEQTRDAAATEENDYQEISIEE